MKKYITIALCLVALVCLAANPTFHSFITTQFGVTSTTVAIKSGAEVTNLLDYGTLRLPNIPGGSGYFAALDASGNVTAAVPAGGGSVTVDTTNITTNAGGQLTVGTNVVTNNEALPWTCNGETNNTNLIVKGQLQLNQANGDSDEQILFQSGSFIQEGESTATGQVLIGGVSGLTLTGNGKGGYGGIGLNDNVTVGLNQTNLTNVFCHYTNTALQFQSTSSPGYATGGSVALMGAATNNGGGLTNLNINGFTNILSPGVTNIGLTNGTVEVLTSTTTNLIATNEILSSTALGYGMVSNELILSHDNGANRTDSMQANSGISLGNDQIAGSGWAINRDSGASFQSDIAADIPLTVNGATSPQTGNLFNAKSNSVIVAWINASGSVAGTNGFASYATNQYTINATGYTNTGTKTIRIPNFAGTGVTFSNALSKVNFSVGTVTSGLQILQPNESLSGTLCSGNGVDF